MKDKIQFPGIPSTLRAQLGMEEVGLWLSVAAIFMLLESNFSKTKIFQSVKNNSAHTTKKAVASKPCYGDLQ